MNQRGWLFLNTRPHYVVDYGWRAETGTDGFVSEFVKKKIQPGPLFVRHAWTIHGGSEALIYLLN